MRLHEIYCLVRDTINNWEEPYMSELATSAQRSSLYVCYNPQAIKTMLEPLRIIPSISALIDKVYLSLPGFTIMKKVRMTPQEKAEFTALMRQIHDKLSVMLEMCDVLELEQNSSGFDIKLPPNITLSDLSQCTKDLNNVFTQCPLLHNKEEEIKLRGVDIGSMWLTFMIVGACAATTSYIVNNIAAMVDKIIAIRNHISVCEQHEELTRQVKLENEMLQSVVEANKTIIKALTRNAAEELAAENNITSTEDIERINGSLKILKEWMDKGMEVYAAVDAPKEVKAVFPPLEMQMMSYSKTEKLSSRNDDEEKKDGAS